MVADSVPDPSSVPVCPLWHAMCARTDWHPWPVQDCKRSGGILTYEGLSLRLSHSVNWRFWTVRAPVANAREMETSRRRSHSGRLAGFLLCLIQLWLLTPRVSAQQPGFTSIDCGGSGAAYPDGVGIQWEPDSISLLPNLAASSNGTVQSGAIDLEQAMRTLRYFPAESAPAKSCFVLPVAPGSLYLVRAGFFYGNYDSKGSTDIQFQIALESTVWQNITWNLSNTSPLYIEAVTPSLQTSELNVCLIRSVSTSTPFINTLELRQLDNLMYQTATPATNNDFMRVVNFYLVQRVNFGDRSNSTLRYPRDLYDRRWPPYLEIYPELIDVVNTSTTQEVSADSTRDLPPNAVMQTAITAPNLSYSYTKGLVLGEVYSMYMFYAELEKKVLPHRRIMEIHPSYYAAGKFDPIDLTELRPPFSTLQFGNTARTLNSLPVTTNITRSVNSTLNPIINADELYHVVTCENGTYSFDVEDLAGLKKALNLSQWTGDPCLPASWDELQCSRNSSEMRVTSLNLSGKNLSGLIPADNIEGLGAVISIDLSSNTFTGPFPSLANLSDLQTLNISNNQLTGAIPAWVSTLKSLRVLDVSNNNLRGPLPDTLTRLGDNFRYSGNPLLGSKKSSSSIGPVIGGVVGGIVLLLVVSGILICCCCNRPKIEKLLPSSGVGGGGIPSEPVSPEPARLPVRPGKAQPYTFHSIQMATNNFGKQISVGGFGSVFLGTLPDNRQVAVKKISASSQQSLREFVTEIDFLSTIHHRNLVSLLGYCRESSELIVLYEYMAGGDLRRRLYGPNATSDPLSWKARLTIAVDAARGIEYLHHGCRPTIIHRGLTSSSILLTSKLDAKVSDFGLSKLIGDGKSNLTTTITGDTEYLDPEFNQTGTLTEKSDVYSYGVILLEIMCGQPPVPPEGARLASSQGPLRDRVRSAMSGGSLGRLMDPFMSGRYRSESAWKFAEVAMNCLRGSGSKRPTFTQIISGLLEAVELENEGPEADRYSSVPINHSRQSRARLPLPEYPSSPDTGYLAEDMPSQIFHASEQPAPR